MNDQLNNVRQVADALDGYATGDEYQRPIEAAVEILRGLLAESGRLHKMREVVMEYGRGSNYNPYMHRLQVILAEPEGEAPVAAEPAAWRYQDSRGHYRYRGYKPGFDKEYAILKPVPLYLHHAPQTPAQPEARRPVSDLWDHGDIQPIPNDKPRRNMVLVPADKLRELQQAAKAQPEALTPEEREAGS